MNRLCIYLKTANIMLFWKKEAVLLKEIKNTYSVSCTFFSLQMTKASPLEHYLAKE